MIDKMTMGLIPADRGPSRAIWNNCPWMKLQNNPMMGSHFLDDFTNEGIVAGANLATAAVSALGTTGNWTAFTDATAGSLVTKLTDDVHGIVQLTGTTINEGATIAHPKTAATAGAYKLADGSKLWMEARVSFLNITTAKFGSFVGFAEEGLLTTGAVLAASTPWAIVDKDFVGFLKTNAATTSVASHYNTEGGTAASVNADEATIEADTYIKLGMYCDGATIQFFTNGVPGGSLAINTANFPNDIEMAFYIALMLGHGDLASVNVDWVRIAQEF